MAMLSKVKWWGQEQLTIPDIDNLQDFVEEDFHSYNTKLFTQTSKVVSGFLTAVKSGLDIEVTIANSVLFNTSGTYKAFFVGDSAEPKLEATMADDSVNYVHLQLSRVTGSQASRAFWDPTLNNSEGGEFIEDVDTAVYLEVSLYVNQTGFSSDADRIPLAEIYTGSSATPAVPSGTIGNIHDRRNMFFRLGTGTDPTHEYNLTTPAEDDEDWSSADRQVLTEKDWKDLVMTNLKKIQGTTYWWQSPPGSLTSSLYKLTDGGVWSWNITTPDISAFLVVNNARILNPLIAFASNGLAGGTFTVNSITGLAEGDIINLVDDIPNTLRCVIKSINPVGPPYTIEVELAELSFTADAFYVILGTAFINYIKQVTESPILLGPNYVAYVDLDVTQTLDMAVSVVKTTAYVNSDLRFIVARRYGDACFIG